MLVVLVIVVFAVVAAKYFHLPIFDKLMNYMPGSGKGAIVGPGTADPVNPSADGAAQGCPNGGCLDLGALPHSYAHTNLDAQFKNTLPSVGSMRAAASGVPSLLKVQFRDSMPPTSMRASSGAFGTSKMYDEHMLRASAPADIASQFVVAPARMKLA
jgi:hypothetical protein